MKPSRCLLLILLLWATTAPTAFAQESVGDVQAQLTLADGKNIFRMGEPIRLALSFTARVDGYQLNVTTTKPASAIDEILLSPEAGAFHWLEQHVGRQGYMPDHASIMTLSANPSRVVLPLNDWLRFDRPGRYTVRVRTRRVLRPSALNETRPALTLTTNEVSFEVQPMSAAEEEREVRRLSALIDAARNWQEEARLTEELSYLAGEATTRELVRRYLTTTGRTGNYSQNIYFGLIMARNQGLVVELLEAALREPQIPATHQLLHTLTRQRAVQLGVEPPPIGGLINPAAQQEQSRFDVIRNAYVRELAASLPRRAGRSRTTTAMTVLGNLPATPEQAAGMLASVREILLQDFAGLHPYDQEYLLRVYWEQLRDPALVPVLERMITANRATPSGYLVRGSALKRLLELNQERARPFVLAEIRDPTSVVDFDVLRALNAETLPEADEALLTQIRAFAPQRQNRDMVLLRQKVLLAARYASGAIYDGLMEVYREWGARWQPDARGILLGYFARYNEPQAIQLIEEALEGLSQGRDFTFLSDLTRVRYSEGIDALLRRRLESTDPRAVGTAAYLMSQHGPASGRPLIEARLARWVREWRARVAELEARGANVNNESLIVEQMAQVNLIMALLRAKSWQLTEEEARQLRQSCLTDLCRRHHRMP